jgi:hypothetical protein
MASRFRRLVLGSLALLLASVLLVACGSSGTTQASYCQSINNLKDSVKAVGSVNVVENGTSSLKAALTEVKTNLAAVEQTASEEFASQTSQVKASVDQFTTTAQSVKSSPSTGGVSQLKAAAESVGAATRELVAAANCG